MIFIDITFLCSSRHRDLSSNGLRVIEQGAFRSLSDLRRLDLSSNRITALTGDQMDGLSSLKRLKLADNPLRVLHSSLPSALPSLAFLDLSSTSLWCDCSLLWLVAAVNGQPLPPLDNTASASPGAVFPPASLGSTGGGRSDSPLRVSKGTVCAGPQRLRDVALRSLSLDDLMCHSGQEGPAMLDLDPGWDQVVFAGDSLTLRCFLNQPSRVPEAGSSSKPTNSSLPPKIFWYQDDVLIHPTTSTTTSSVTPPRPNTSTSSTSSSSNLTSAAKPAVTTTSLAAVVPSSPAPEVTMPNNLKPPNTRLVTVRPEVVTPSGELVPTAHDSAADNASSAEGIVVSTQRRQDGIESLVQIRRLGAHHGGQWGCRVETHALDEQKKTSIKDGGNSGHENTTGGQNGFQSGGNAGQNSGNGGQNDGGGAKEDNSEGQDGNEVQTVKNSTKPLTVGIKLHDPLTTIPKPPSPSNSSRSSKSLSIYVIHRHTKYCPVNETRNDRGAFSWPYTVAGVNVSLPCHTSPPSTSSFHHNQLYHFTGAHPNLHVPTAYHTCSRDGTWNNLNTDECPFASKSTRILQQFSLTNLTASKTSLLKSARSLHNFTRDGEHVLRSSADVVFLARTLQYYSSELLNNVNKTVSMKSSLNLPSQVEDKYPFGFRNVLGAAGTAAENREVALLLIDLVGASMSASSVNLTTAQLQDLSCSRLLGTLWSVMEAVPSITQATPPQLHVLQIPIPERRSLLEGSAQREVHQGPEGGLLSSSGEFNTEEPSASSRSDKSESQKEKLQLQSRGEKRLKRRSLPLESHDHVSRNHAEEKFQELTLESQSRVTNKLQNPNLNTNHNDTLGSQVTDMRQSGITLTENKSIFFTTVESTTDALVRLSTGGISTSRIGISEQTNLRTTPLEQSDFRTTPSPAFESSDLDRTGTIATEINATYSVKNSTLDSLNVTDLNLNSTSPSPLSSSSSSPKELGNTRYLELVRSDNKKTLQRLQERLHDADPPRESMVCVLHRRSLHSSHRRLSCHDASRAPIRPDDAVVDAVLEMPGTLFSLLDLPSSNSSVKREQPSHKNTDNSSTKFPTNDGVNLRNRGGNPRVSNLPNATRKNDSYAHVLPQTQSQDFVAVDQVTARSEDSARTPERSSRTMREISHVIETAAASNQSGRPFSRSIESQLMNDAFQARNSNWLHLNFPSDVKANTQRIQIYVFETSKLFPHITPNNSSFANWDVTSVVMGARVGGQGIDESFSLLGGQVTVTLRTTLYSNNIRPVWWDAGDVHGGSSGRWSSDGCKILKIVNSQVVFQCNRLAHYGVMQDMNFLKFGDKEKGANFRFSAPAVYLGSFVCALLLMITIVTWAVHHPFIHTTSKNKHSYINTWIALVMLIVLFTVGVYQTENRALCQGVGVVLHYLSSCVLLWIIVSVSNLYKKVTKALRPPLLSDDPPPDSPLPPKPMLRFYLVGWGIALILCGISAAVNLPHYAGYSYCFLAWAPSLGAFYAPCVVLVIILSVFCLLTHCMIKSGPGSYSEAAANTETTELELLDTASPNSENVTTHSGHTSHLTAHLNSDRLNADELSLTSSTSENLYDSHHSPLTQLRAHEVTLLLFVLTWASAAITTAGPFQTVIPHHTTIFSLVYALCSSSLGVFIFLFFCLGRSDVKQAWHKTKLKSCWNRKSDHEEIQVQVANNAVPASSSGGSGSSGTHLIPVSNASVASANTNNLTAIHSVQTIHNNHQEDNAVSAPVANSVHSYDSSRSPTIKSSSVSHQVTTPNKSEAFLKTENIRPQGTALQLLNFGATAESFQYSPEMFYNPKQAGVAKRFFQKQRMKQLIKQNNLGLNREDDSDCNSSVLYRPRPVRSNNSGSDMSGFDPSCLGASSKVNNTNIHVDHNLYSYMSVNKQATKTPTPELLCVFGPNKSQNIVNEEKQNRSFSRSPNLTDHIPRIDATNAYQYSSESSYQTPAKVTDRKDNTNMHLTPSGVITRQLSPLDGSSAEDGDFRRSRKTGHRGQARRPRHRRARSKGGTSEEKWIDGNDCAVPLNVIPQVPPLLASGDPGVKSVPGDVSSQMYSSPIPDSFANELIGSSSPLFGRVQSGSPASLVSKIDTINQSQSINAPRTDAHPSWPHVLSSSTKGKKTPGQRLNIPWHENLQAVGSWDSETGEEMSCCEGGGEKRFSVGDVSDRASVCGTFNTSRNSMCSDMSVDGSSIGTSLVAGADTSPPASLLVSDSPFDSPLHRLHQNTPDDVSVASSFVSSPVRRPFSPSSFPYLQGDTNAFNDGDDDSVEGKSKLKRRKKGNKKSNQGSKSYPESPASPPACRLKGASLDRQVCTVPAQIANPGKNLVADSSDPQLNLVKDDRLGFQFRDDAESVLEDADNDATQTDRSSSVSTDIAAHQLLMTTPRSEGSSDSDGVPIAFINQEPPLNIVEEFSRMDKERRAKKKNRQGMLFSSNDRIHEDGIPEYLGSDSDDEAERKSSGTVSSTPTAGTPLLSPQKNGQLFTTPREDFQFYSSPQNEAQKPLTHEESLFHLSPIEESQFFCRHEDIIQPQPSPSKGNSGNSPLPTTGRIHGASPNASSPSSPLVPFFTASLPPPASSHALLPQPLSTSTPIRQFTSSSVSPNLSSNLSIRDAQTTKGPTRDQQVSKGSSPLPTIERLKRRTPLVTSRPSTISSGNSSGFLLPGTRASSPVVSSSTSFDSDPNTVVSMDVCSKSGSIQQPSQNVINFNVGRDSSGATKNSANESAMSSFHSDTDGASKEPSSGSSSIGVNMCANPSEACEPQPDDSSAESCSSRETCV
ncbi:GPS motif protein [Trinorchestia longiramus]|nr:GPS motif protein [Trinorchestia longiramus]